MGARKVDPYPFSPDYNLSYQQLLKHQQFEHSQFQETRGLLLRCVRSTALRGVHESTGGRRNRRVC